jgi:hypothetical protein
MFASYLVIFINRFNGIIFLNTKFKIAKHTVLNLSEINLTGFYVFSE